MKQKYIEGTNQQYSIQEDGKVFRNYHYSKLGEKVIDNNPIELKGYNRKENIIVFELRVNNKKSIFRYQSALLRKHFYPNKRLNAFKKRTRKLDRIKSNRNKENITKAYIANCLNTKIENISEELYQFYKAKIKLERLIKTKQNATN